MNTASLSPAGIAKSVALLSLAAIVAGCATKPDIRENHDPSADFRSYKTFAFYDDTGGRARYTSLLDARLKQATRQQMEQHDYVYSERDPDLRLNLQLKVVDKQELRSTPGARGYRGWSGGIETVEYRKGSLAIDVIDVQRNALVWRGVAEGRLDAKAIEQPGPAVDGAVSEILARFPGGKSK